MSRFVVDYADILGRIKPMHAVNNGPFNVPLDAKPLAYSSYTNFDVYREASFPYARTHDASLCYEYGGEHIVDISAVFPDFEKDPTLPESYDFALTDIYLRGIAAAGTKVFYRLGSKIEHWPKKYGTLVPADFAKWAVVCEHIIRHYNEGWADGLHMGIEYWEIWNEPDLDADDSSNKRNWGGTASQFYEFYAVAATHLKAAFPNLKIGGPAVASVENTPWLEGFFQRLTRDGRRVPLDFFSWHLYTVDPCQVAAKAALAREWLDRYGYGDAESILDEWNYVSDWNEAFLQSIQQMLSIRGAAFDAACMCVAQRSPVDLLMYYDARPGIFNGLFDFYSCQPLKGYYVFAMFSRLYRLGYVARCESGVEGVEAVSATDQRGSAAPLLSYYAREENAPAKEFALELRGLTGRTLRYALLDACHDGQVIREIAVEAERKTLTLTLEPNSVVLLTV